MEPLKAKKKVLKTVLTWLRDKVASAIKDADSIDLRLFDSKTSDLLNDFKLLFDSIFVTCKLEELDDFFKEKETIDDSIDELRLNVSRKMNKTDPKHYFHLCQTVMQVFCRTQKAYGVVIYTRLVKDCNDEANLLVSKSRVAPLTKITMARLELLGSLLAARLASKVKAIADLKRPSKVSFRTDSKITLHWINGSNKRWKSFVSNRVPEIQSLCDTIAWAHCPGEQNPADFLSRGVSVEILLNGDLWWKGPQF
ncbi:hypothetical protein AVEN_116987-1 [Araneus ventricosus]|uniref:Uncharacterized protein n=1 Tax=Araneus ventricosus TaxID=182803 RepID=A0A4Y2QRX7_ARAVE|nr:hypothetical protein AVEN_116987-1 [Araneus ventricosus]